MTDTKVDKLLSWLDQPVNVVADGDVELICGDENPWTEIEA